MKIYGPREWINTTITVGGGGLSEEWVLTEENNFKQNGPNGTGVGDCAKKWRITNTARRRASRILPAEVGISDAQFNVGGTSLQTRFVREPVFQATWDGSTWWTVPGFKLDIRDGYVTTPTPVYQYDPDTSAASNDYLPPTDVRLVYAYLGNPITVRFPSSGWGGTTNTVAGMQVEKRLYDEMLAIGYEQGSPVTSAARTAQFVKLANQFMSQSRTSSTPVVARWRGSITISSGFNVA